LTRKEKDSLDIANTPAVGRSFLRVRAVNIRIPCRRARPGSLLRHQGAAQYVVILLMLHNLYSDFHISADAQCDAYDLNFSQIEPALRKNTTIRNFAMLRLHRNTDIVSHLIESQP
jgi:hypothetical protein